MKHILTFALLLVISFSLSSQIEFAPVGAKWIQNAGATNQGSPFYHPLADYFVIESTGDTLVNGTTYRKVGEHLLYQDAEKIYYLWNDTLRLLYDFGVQVGDTVTFELLGCLSNWLAPAPHRFVVNYVGQITVDQQLLKRINCLSIEQHQLPDYEYIEKIGYTTRVVEDKAGCVTFPEHTFD